MTIGVPPGGGKTKKPANGFHTLPELRRAELAVRQRSRRLAAAHPAATAEIDDDAPLDAAAVKRERRKRNFLQLQKQYERAMRPLKILINFWCAVRACGLRRTRAPDDRTHSSSHTGRCACRFRRRCT